MKKPATLNNIRDVLLEGCNTTQDLLVRMEFYGGIDGLSEPTASGSSSLALSDMTMELHTGCGIGFIYNQDFMENNY